MRVLFAWTASESMAIAALSAALKRAGHQVGLVLDPGFLRYYTGRAPRDPGPAPRVWRRMLSEARQFEPDLIAVTCPTNVFPWVRAVAVRFKEALPHVPVVVGGCHPTLVPEAVIADPAIDLLCVGEGDEALVELADRWSDGERPTDIANFWLKLDGHLVRNPLRPPVADLDGLPFGDRELFAAHGLASDRLYLMTGRGCPYRCAYCSNPGREYGPAYVRRHSVNYVLSEIRHHMSRSRIRSIHFYDDTFALNRTWLLEFCTRYGPGIGLPFYCLVRADTISEQVVAALAQAGCVALSLGLESGNAEFRRRVLRRTDELADVELAVALCRRYGIEVTVFCMYGLPGEDFEMMWQTTAAAWHLRPDAAFTHTFYPYPGLPLTQYAADLGQLDDGAAACILRGEGHTHTETILRHPYGHAAANLKLLTPLLVRLPPWPRLQRAARAWARRPHRRTTKRLLAVASLAYLSRWESRGRARELMRVRLHGWRRLLSRSRGAVIR